MNLRSDCLLPTALVLLLLGGCTASTGGPADPSSDGQEDKVSDGRKEPSAEQQAAIADGIVTREEYEQGFRAYQACMAAAGESIVVTNMDSTIIGYYGIAGDSNVDLNCYIEHFDAIDAEWQMAHEDLTAKAGFLAQCLQDHGYEPSSEGPDPAPGVDGRVRFDALRAQIMASGLDGKCVIPLDLDEEQYVHPGDEGTDSGQK